MEIQKQLGCGSLSRTKGSNSYHLIINDSKGLILLINILNGYMRTSKIEILFKLIEFLNNRFPNLYIQPKQKDLTNINNNEWLSGFIDANGCFFANVTSNSINCSFQLVHNHFNLSQKDIMLIISDYLNIELNIFKYSNYLKYKIKTNKLKNNLKIVSYLENYPLFTSKYLNYLDWLLVLNIIINDKHKTIEGRNQIYLIKEGMNNKRRNFNWNHLQYFYNLNK